MRPLLRSWVSIYFFLFLMLILGVMGYAAEAPKSVPAGASGTANPEAKARVEKFMTGASVFVQNDGQWPDATIKFALDGLGANVGITDKGPKFQFFWNNPADVHRPEQPDQPVQLDKPDKPDKPELHQPHPKTSSPAPDSRVAQPSALHEFSLTFDGASPTIPAGRGKSERTFNYMLGDVANHRENVPSYNAVWYENLYPGISLELTGRRTGLKYTFHIAPGADPRVIRLRYEGIEKLTLTPEGALQIHLAPEWPPLTDGAPKIHQEINGQKKIIPGRFTLFDSHTYGFDITGPCDPTLPIIIDPYMAW